MSQEKKEENHEPPALKYLKELAGEVSNLAKEVSGLKTLPNQVSNRYETQFSELQKTLQELKKEIDKPTGTPRPAHEIIDHWENCPECRPLFSKELEARGFIRKESQPKPADKPTAEQSTSEESTGARDGDTSAYQGLPWQRGD